MGVTYNFIKNIIFVGFHLTYQLADFRAYFKEKEGYKPKETMWAIRAAVTGRTHGADMVSILLILGKDKVRARMQKTLG